MPNLQPHRSLRDISSSVKDNILWFDVEIIPCAWNASSAISHGVLGRKTKQENLLVYVTRTRGGTVKWG
jgi:hypothetical protein